MADDRAVVEEDRVALPARVRVSGEREERVAPGAGQGRGSQEGEPAVRKGDGGRESAPETLAGSEEAVPATRDRLDRPRPGQVGLAAGDRLVAFVEEAEEGGAEGVGEERGDRRDTIV